MKILKLIFGTRLILLNLHLILCTISWISSSELVDLPESVINKYLPDCSSSLKDKRSNLFIVSTLDGKFSVVDALDGTLQWSKEITTEPLISSTISDFIVNNKGEIVRILPSLDGNLFVHNGRTIQQTQFSTEKLLKNSMKFSENVLLVGGQENRIIGLNLADGEVVYECGFNGCSQQDNQTFDNVVLVRKTSQSVRAVNSLTGQEEWHFVVNDPKLLHIGNQNCQSNPSGSNHHETKKSKHVIDFKVIVPNGVIHSIVYRNNELNMRILEKEWNFKFDSPIVNMWHYIDGQLESVNLFDRQTIDIRSFNNQLNYEHSSDYLMEPDFYIGTYNNQLYIQKSNKQLVNIKNIEEDFKNDDNINSKKHLQNNQVDHDWVENFSEHNTAIVQVEWKQTVDDKIEVKRDNSPKFEITNKIVFPIATFNKLNSTGYYVFKLAQPIKDNQCDRIRPDNRSILTGNYSEETENIITIIVHNSLSYYWKEVLVICLLSWCVFNFFTSIIKRYFRKLFNKVNRNQENLISKEQSNYHVQDHTSTNLKQLAENSPTSNDELYCSRFLQDFEPICLLGEGGFGSVYKAKHKIDEIHYAVKRVRIPKQKEKQERFLREIRALSKLEHPGIVRYYYTWIEEPPVGWEGKHDLLSNLNRSDDFEEDDSLSYDQQDTTNQSLKLVCETNISQDSYVEFINSGDPLNQIEKFESQNCISKSIDISETSNLQQNESISLNEETERKKIKLKNNIYVYIQMQLCKKETLKDWLFENQVRDKKKMIEIFSQLIEAVNYVHSNKLIHRDLKPSNILFSMDGAVKIGDFGLVTVNFEDQSDSGIGDQVSNIHTNDVGTQLYMSPEQVNNERYDHKVDIFSMGIILYELLESFQTESERIQTLNKVRRREFPLHFVENHSKESGILNKLLSHRPQDRPEANDLLILLNKWIVQ
ncbi:Eukaryotic translation initiation factor 2-alpha kinase 3 [Blomia tropicalis]|nr:Eukaryotic translation initiation factor 2-alpha kinase 3 [Blomia tropicalis]